MANGQKLIVSIVMGSDSDWPVMKVCQETLEEFEIPHEVRVLSAHRAPEATAAFAREAQERGLQVLIAAAGMAAHLAGALAAHSALPVIGVPLASGALQGVDALLATVQMPPGIPVATVGIGVPGAKNAALLAVQILARADGQLANKFDQYKAKMAAGVEKKNRKLQDELRG